MNLLTIRDLTLQFGGVTALNEINLDLQEGMVMGLIGPNGAGKSTLFNCISRYYTPNKGKITYSKKNLLKFKPYQLIHLGVSRTFQNTELVPELNVLDNILVGLHHSYSKQFISSFFTTKRYTATERELRNKALELVKRVQITDWLNTSVNQLPLGVRKRIEIARAVISKPKLLLLDEPAGGMNTAERSELIHLIRELHQDMNLSILLVEHDMNFVSQLCEEVLVLNFGGEIARGSPDEIRKNPKVIETYIGGHVDVT